MKRNKIMKKVLAMAGMAAVALTLGGARVAEAACAGSCSYSSRPRSVGSSRWHAYNHEGYRVEGNNVYLYVCDVWYQGYEMELYCTGCGDVKSETYMKIDEIHMWKNCPSYGK